RGGGEQLRGRGRILRYAVAVLVERRKRVLRLGAAGVGGAAQEFGGARHVLAHLPAFEKEQRQIIRGRDVAELRGLVEQCRGLGLVLRSAAAGEAEHGE